MHSNLLKKIKKLLYFLHHSLITNQCVAALWVRTTRLGTESLGWPMMAFIVW